MSTLSSVISQPGVCLLQFCRYWQTQLLSINPFDDCVCPVQALPAPGLEGPHDALGLGAGREDEQGQFQQVEALPHLDAEFISREFGHHEVNHAQHGAWVLQQRRQPLARLHKTFNGVAPGLQDLRDAQNGGVIVVNDDNRFGLLPRHEEVGGVLGRCGGERRSGQFGRSFPRLAGPVGQFQCEGTPPARLAFHRDGAAVGFGQLEGDGEAQPHAAVLPGN